MKFLHFSVLIAILMILLRVGAMGQNMPLSTSDKRAQKIFNSAYAYLQSGDLDRALTDIDKAVALDPAFVEAWLLRGDICADKGLIDQAIDSYRRAVNTGKEFSPAVYYVLAGMELSDGQYQAARENFRRVLEIENLPESKRVNAIRGIERAEFAIRAMAEPVPFNPVNLGDSINTEFEEFINGIVADGSRLYFTRWDPSQNYAGQGPERFNEDFYVSLNSDSLWRKAVNLGGPINTSGNEGALSVSPDGTSIFFAACNRADGFGSCDLYRSVKTGDIWSVPENLGASINSPQWDSQPSFSSDGKTLYFSSKRKGGKGSSDIWKSELMADGSWSAPENLGDSVNTPAEEMAPFIHPDDQTLYYSSKGHPGMGGYDLFVARKSGKGSWESTRNLGYPINTNADEMTLIVNASGNLAYISSDKLGGKGKQDIYMFELYPGARPMLTTYLKGIVYDQETNNRLEAAFELTDLATGKVVASSTSDRVTGEFLLVLPTNRDYALNVSRKNYLFFSDHFKLTGYGTAGKPFIRNIPLKPIRVGEEVVLKNIFFDTDKFTLKSESLVELNKLLMLLQQNPTLKIEISGHTDLIGTAEHNRELSKNRARAVYDFLVGQNIASSRLSYAGYGFDRPIDDNTTESGRANNRRTEFKVIGN